MQMTALFVSISGMPENRAVILFDGIISFEIRLSILDRLMAWKRSVKLSVRCGIGCPRG